MFELPEIRFTQADADLAHKTWRCSCGPAALAALFGMTLEEVRPRLRDFEVKGYMNARRMLAIVAELGVWYRAHVVDAAVRPVWPAFGLVLIQWDGPWLQPGMPYAARLCYTHWVASVRTATGQFVFDINAVERGGSERGGWLPQDVWECEIAPVIAGEVPRATGLWSIATNIEARPRGTWPAEDAT